MGNNEEVLRSGNVFMTLEATDEKEEIYVIMKEFCGCDMPIRVTTSKTFILRDGQKKWTLVKNSDGDYELEDWKQ